MPFLPLDLQANYGNLEYVIKEVNKIQNLAEQINYNSSITIEKFAKEIYEKIIETEESTEQQKIENRKKREEKNRRKKKEYFIFYDMTEEEIRKKIELTKFVSHKGNFVNLFK